MKAEPKAPQQYIQMLKLAVFKFEKKSLLSLVCSNWIRL